VLTIEVDRLALEPGAKVLDLGCGGGRHVRAMRFVPGVAAVGVDLGEKEVVEATRMLRELDTATGTAFGPNPEAGPWAVMRGSGYRLPFKTGAFDCVIISEVLEHLHEDDRALDEVTRVLRPGGKLAVSVPRTAPEALCWALSHQYRNSPGGHIRIYRRSQLRGLLVRHGYRIFGSHFAHALHSPYWWLKCAVGMDNDAFPLVRWYHRLLVWDLMQRPKLTRLLDTMLNPLIGKSIVMYAVKG
jgi:SAM-dependent methyltransferase